MVENAEYRTPCQLIQTLDLDHWNRQNPNEEPIVAVTDITEDVNERLAGPDEAAA